MSTFEKVKSIFYPTTNQSFEGSHESINEIAFLIDEEYLSLTDFPIATKEEYLNLFKSKSSLDKSARFDAAGGGDAHMALKLLGKKYLHDERGLNSGFEQPFCGYYPDVISEDKTVVIECGVTANPEKILNYFKQGGLKELIQLPYPSFEDEHLIGYSFKPNEDLKDFLEFLQEEKHNKIRQIFQNRKRS